MSAEIVSLADHRAAEDAAFAAHLERAKVEAAALQEQLDQLKLLIAVMTRLVTGCSTLSDKEFDDLADQIALPETDHTATLIEIMDMYATTADGPA